MLELLPKAQETTAAMQPAPARLWLKVAGAVLAVGLVLGGGALALRAHAPGDPTPSVAEQQARLEAYVQAGTLPLPAIPAPARAEALASMNLEAQPAATQTLLRQDSTKLAWLTLRDDRDEDGDTVEIISQGYSRTVRLTNAPIRIAVPVPPGGVVNVRGVYDGGGGITVAIDTEQGSVAVPVMAVGQVIGVPVSAR